MGFSRQEYWSGLPFPSPGDLPDPGIKPASLMSPVLAGGFFTTSATWEALVSFKNFQNPFAKIKRFGRGRCRLFQVWFARMQVPCRPLRKDGWVRTSFQWLECVHGGEVWSSPLESEMGAMGWGDRATQQEGPSSQYCSLLSM